MTLHPRDGGPSRQLQIKQVDGALDIDLDGTRVEQVDRLMVTWPSAGLRTTTLIDTPGIASMSLDTADRASGSHPGRRADGGGRGALPDAPPARGRRAVPGVLSRPRGGAGGPVNTIAVLSRADEIGAGGSTR